jgi:DNA-binding PadR family transcriptional regulator
MDDYRVYQDFGPSHSKMLISEHFFYIVCLMSSRDYLGEFEHIVVLALLRLGDRAYGVTVRQEIELRIGREVSIGAIYATLDRLEAKGYVNSRLGDPTPERGGRSKRFFRVSAKGILAINRTHRALQSMTAGLNLVRSY